MSIANRAGCAAIVGIVGVCSIEAAARTAAEDATGVLSVGMGGWRVRYRAQADAGDWEELVGLADAVLLGDGDERTTAEVDGEGLCWLGFPGWDGDLHFS